MNKRIHMVRLAEWSQLIIDRKNYEKTVENVMAFFKEKEVCSSSRKSHKECYQSFEDYLSKENAAFSPQLRDRWLDFVKDEGPPQKYAMWRQYLIQLEEMDAAGTISDRRLYLNRSDYEKPPGSWREKSCACVHMNCRLFMTGSPSL